MQKKKEKKKKKLSAILIISIFVFTLFLVLPKEKQFFVKKVNSPTSFDLTNGKFVYDDLDSFDTRFTDKNKKLSADLGISETEAFIAGNLGQYYAEKLMNGRSVYIKNHQDLIYQKFSYRDKFYYSGFCLKNNEPCYKEGFDNLIETIRRTKYKVLDYETEKYYDVSAPEVKNLNDFIIIRKYYIPKIRTANIKKQTDKKQTLLDTGDVKIYFSDLTSKIKPDRNCSSSICKEILDNINSAQKTIDMAIYGYSRTPEVEKALENAIKRGVKIRMVYDSDLKGQNIYPDTNIITKLIKDNKSDINSIEAKNIMHNKFYIFDDKILITGSANLSHTDMSGFNSNSIVVIKSENAAKIYKTEFEQMYNGKFHNAKSANQHNKIVANGIETEIYFSPQDKSILNGIIPLIKQAKKYIYIPTFVLTDKKVTDELIKAKNRGVEIKIIMDALNASVQHSKHRELRLNGIEVKTENYAGKMHSKSMIIDDMYTVIGSMNFSNSGENYNDENLVILKSQKIAKFYKDFFLYQWNRIDNKWLKFNARAEGKDSIGSCSDGIDNNYDGLTDSDDMACK